MEKLYYIIEYKYSKNSEPRFRAFDKLEHAYDYYCFLQKYLILDYLVLRACYNSNEVLICGN